MSATECVPRPDACAGNVRIKCGTASHEEMAALTGLKLSLSNRLLTATLTITIFNGRTGNLACPASLRRGKRSSTPSLSATSL